MLAHDVKQHERAGDIVLVVFEGLGHALAHSLQSGKVDAGVEGELSEHFFEAFTVADVNLHEGDGCAADGSHALKRLGIAVAKIVDDNHVVSRIVQFNQGVGADKSGTAGNKDSHGVKS